MAGGDCINSLDANGTISESDNADGAGADGGNADITTSNSATWWNQYDVRIFLQF